VVGCTFGAGPRFASARVWIWVSSWAAGVDLGTGHRVQVHCRSAREAPLLNELIDAPKLGVRRS